MYFFIKRASKINKVFELRENSRGELFLNFPRRKMGYIPRDIIQNLAIGSAVQINTASLIAVIDHFSAHLSGQRHFKTTQNIAVEKVSGSSIICLDRVIPLATILASMHDDQLEKYPAAGSRNWIGFNLLPDTNYLIMDIFAVPKRSSTQITLNHTITNLKKSKETFDVIPVEMKNYNIVIAIRSSNYSQAKLRADVVYLQSEGKGLTVTRVEGATIDAQVAELEVNELT